MNKKRITYIVSTLGRSGPTNQLYNLVKFLEPELFEITVVTLSSEPPNSRWTDFVGLDIHLIPLDCNRLGSFFYVISKLRRIIQRLRPNILHTQGVRPDLFSRFLDSHVVRFSTQRNNPYNDYSMLYGRLVGSVLAACHFNALRSIPNVIACSKSIASNNVSRGISTDCIQNGVDLSNNQRILSDAEKISIRSDLSLPLDGRMFVFAGPFIKRKAPDFLVQAFIDIPDNHNDFLCLLGDGPLFGRCKQLSEGKRNIFLLGHTRDVDRYLSVSNALISPSRDEGLPNTILEALAWGLPIIVSDIPSHREILNIQPDAGSLFNKDNVGSLSQAIRQWSDCPRKRDAARTIVVNHLNAERMAAEYRKRYQSAEF